MDRAPQHHHPPTPSSSSSSSSLSTDYSLSTTTTSLFVFDLELQALLAMGVQCLHLWFCLFCDEQVENGGSSVVFGKRSKTTNGKEQGKDKAEISGEWCKFKPLPLCYYFFFQRMNSKLERVFSGIYPFNYERAEHNTGLNVWCFQFLFCPLDKENLPQS